MFTPISVAEIQQAVRELDEVRVIGGGTKSALSAGATLSLAEWSGVLEYDPSEYTFTAKAGTRLAEVRDLLSASGQYLPFDPPLVDAGSTLGGMVAAGLSGPGRYRYGGVRDFLLGLEFVTGDGEVHRGGGKVVKNAAGFDFPKLMVGARGTFGVITEVTFKVFPAPRVYRSLVVEMGSASDAQRMMGKLAMSTLELACLDFAPPGRLLLRVGGLAESMPRRTERIQELMGLSAQVLEGEEEEALWRDAREFAWAPSSATLLKIAISPAQVPELEQLLSKGSLKEVARRYSVGGNVAWLAWPPTLGPEELIRLLSVLGRSAVAVRGRRWGILGPRKGDGFERRLVGLFDPKGKFTRLEDAASQAPALAAP